MKKIFLATMAFLALVAFTNVATASSDDGNGTKCGSGKCGTSTPMKCGAGKCGGGK
jgi:uncharacterized low-complexity protein